MICNLLILLELTKMGFTVGPGLRIGRDVAFGWLLQWISGGFWLQHQRWIWVSSVDKF